MIETTSTMIWRGMIPVDDTALAVADSGGSRTPVLYLNGQFATQGYWRRVIAELGPDWRHITYDERARGRRSGRSADYSFEAASGLAIVSRGLTASSASRGSPIGSVVDFINTPWMMPAIYNIAHLHRLDDDRCGAWYRWE